MEESVKKRFLKQIRPGMTKEEMVKLVLGFYPYGRIVGKLAGWYIRWYRGRPIVYKLPEDYHISQTKASVLNRNSLGAATNLAKVLIRIPAIRKVWDSAEVEGNCAYRKLIKYNKKRLVNNFPSLNVSITPDKYDLYSENIISFNNKDVLSIHQNENFIGNDLLVTVIAVYDPVAKSDKDFQLIKLSDSAVCGEIQLTEEQQEICRRYKKYIIYSALIREIGDEVIWSNTMAISGEFAAAHSSMIFIMIPVWSETGSRNSEAGKTEFRERMIKFKRKAHPPPGTELNTAA